MLDRSTQEKGNFVQLSKNRVYDSFVRQYPFPEPCALPLIPDFGPTQETLWTELQNRHQRRPNEEKFPLYSFESERVLEKRKRLQIG